MVGRCSQPHCVPHVNTSLFLTQVSPFCSLGVLPGLRPVTGGGEGSPLQEVRRISGRQGHRLIPPGRDLMPSWQRLTSSCTATEKGRRSGQLLTYLVHMFEGWVTEQSRLCEADYTAQETRIPLTDSRFYMVYDSTKSFTILQVTTEETSIRCMTKQGTITSDCL